MLYDDWDGELLSSGKKGYYKFKKQEKECDDKKMASNTKDLIRESSKQSRERILEL